jgi:hypothetical protein
MSCHVLLDEFTGADHDTELTCARLLLLLLLLLRLCLGLLWLGLMRCVVALDNPLNQHVLLQQSRFAPRALESLVLPPCSALTSGIPLNST